MKTYLDIHGNYYEKAHYAGTKSQEFMYVSRENFLIDFMGLKGNERILDVGCGSSVFSRLLAKKYPCAEIMGIDISEEAVDFATTAKEKEGLKNVSFMATGINNLPFKNDSFDVIIVSHLIEHLEKPNEALIEVNLKLKKGGILFVTTPNYLSLWPLAEITFDKFCAQKGYNLKEQHISKFNYFSLKREVSRNNFAVKNIKTLYLISLQLALISKRLGWVFFKLDKLLSFTPFGMIIYLKAIKN